MASLSGGVSYGLPPSFPPGPPEPRVEQITHLEIRRVQNGFVVMAFDFRTNHHSMQPPQRSSFVAIDIPGLLAVIQGIAASTEMDWMPTVDLPIVDLVRKPTLAASNSHE